MVISDQVAERHAHGLYQGDGIARDNYPDRIIIFWRHRSGTSATTSSAGRTGRNRTVRA